MACLSPKVHYVREGGYQSVDSCCRCHYMFIHLPLLNYCVRCKEYVYFQNTTQRIHWLSYRSTHTKSTHGSAMTSLEFIFFLISSYVQYKKVKPMNPPIRFYRRALKHKWASECGRLCVYKYSSHLILKQHLHLSFE